jgi:hypothetical protein
MNQKIIKHTIDNYKKILNHLEGHIETGEADEQDYLQSNLLKKEIKKLSINLLIKAKDIKKNDNLYKISNPKEAQKNAFNYLGPTAILYKSEKLNKKFKILNPNNNKYIHFGSNMEDYLFHQNEDRKNNYLKRSSNIKGDWKNNPYSPNILSQRILWM